MEKSAVGAWGSWSNFITNLTNAGPQLIFSFYEVFSIRKWFYPPWASHLSYLKIISHRHGQRPVSCMILQLRLTICSGLRSVAMIIPWPKAPWENKRVYLAYWWSEESKAATQGRNWSRDHQRNSYRSILAYFPWLAQVPFLHSPGLPAQSVTIMQARLS